MDEKLKLLSHNQFLPFHLFLNLLNININLKKKKKKKKKKLKKKKERKKRKLDNNKYLQLVIEKSS